MHVTAFMIFALITDTWIGLIRMVHRTRGLLGPWSLIILSCNLWNLLHAKQPAGVRFPNQTQPERFRWFCISVCRFLKPSFRWERTLSKCRCATWFGEACTKKIRNYQLTGLTIFLEIGSRTVKQSFSDDISLSEFCSYANLRLENRGSSQCFSNHWLRLDGDLCILRKMILTHSTESLTFTCYQTRLVSPFFKNDAQSLLA